MNIIQYCIVNGDIFKAFELLDIVRQERCNLSINSQLVDTLLSKLHATNILSSTVFVFNNFLKIFLKYKIKKLKLIFNFSDSNDLLEGLDYSMRIIDFASPRRMNEIIALLNRICSVLNMKTYIKSDISLENATTTEIIETTVMLASQKLNKN